MIVPSFFAAMIVFSSDVTRARAAGFAAAAAVLALGASAEGMAHSGGVATNVAVTDGRFAESGEPALAVNPRDPRDLLGATQDINPHPGPAPGSFASFDGGATWSDGGLLPLPAGDRVGGDVTVAFNRRGAGFVLSHAGPAGFNVNRLLLWRTADGGRHFGRPTIVFDRQGIVIDHPSLAIDDTRGPHAGTIYAVWTAGAPSRFPLGSRLYVTRSTDGGKTFERARTIGNFPGRYPAVPVANVDNTGVVSILFTIGSGDPYHPPFEPFSRTLVTSRDGGLHFGPPYLITREPVFLPLNGITTANIGALASGNGTLYVALAGRHGNATDILVWRSADQGRSWRGPVPISPPNNPTAAAFQAQLALNPAGTVYLSYLAINHRRVNVYLTQSTDRAATFTAGQRINSASFGPRFGDKTRSPALPWIGDYQALAASPNAIHAVWTDTRTGQMRLYAASIRTR